MLRRLAFVAPVLVVVAVGIFLLGTASPFDPIYQYYGVDVFTATAEDIARVRAQLGLDDGVFVQLWRWLTGLFSGELGTSRAFRQPVADVIAQRLPWTLLLVSVGLVIMIVIALVLGVSQTPWLILHLRASLLTALAEDHVAGARARGLPEWRVVLRTRCPPRCCR